MATYNTTPRAPASAGLSLAPAAEAETGNDKDKATFIGLNPNGCGPRVSAAYQSYLAAKAELSAAVIEVAEKTDHPEVVALRQKGLKAFLSMKWDEISIGFKKPGRNGKIDLI